MWKKAEASKLNKFAAYKWEQLKLKATEAKDITKTAMD